MSDVTSYAATGHRPDKLGGYGFRSEQRLVTVAVEFLAAHRPGECVSGMALGWDMAYALAALQLGIPLVAAVPFEGQERLWPMASQNQYREILAQAVDIVIVSPGGYDSKKMQVRNKWMVDRADVVVAMFDGSMGGTRNCMYYADSQHKPIINLYNQWRTRK